MRRLLRRPSRFCALYEHLDSEGERGRGVRRGEKGREGGKEMRRGSERGRLPVIFPRIRHRLQRIMRKSIFVVTIPRDLKGLFDGISSSLV